MINVFLTSDDIDVSGLTASIHGPDAGAIATFEGCTRADTNDSGTVIALEYEAHPTLAEQQMNALAEEASQRWPVTALVLAHRTGVVWVGEPSVLVAVATSHRGESFAACQWLIDNLKESVAIWKKEVFDDGSAHWVGTP